MITESSYEAYAIILGPDLSTSHKESEFLYQALAAERGGGGHRVVLDDVGVFILLLHHST